eukprot:TRINITY_DN15311_c0_g1_i2.p2 TRINITY_DN15311_c0_g1~~TRINITY_DN15311_c0_g1_i2.p2  ORF type:complete len:148 (-),score=20.35 TRINITY_DN15311_c0_g1_i2:45-488(-)
MLYVKFVDFFFQMIELHPRSTLSSSSAASDVYKRQSQNSSKKIKATNCYIQMKSYFQIQKRNNNKWKNKKTQSISEYRANSTDNDLKSQEYDSIKKIQKSCNSQHKIKLCSQFKKFHWTSHYKKYTCLLYTSPSPRDRQKSRMPSSA